MFDSVRSAVAAIREISTIVCGVVDGHPEPRLDIKAWGLGWYAALSIYILGIALHDL